MRHYTILHNENPLSLIAFILFYALLYAYFQRQNINIYFGVGKL